MDGPLSSNKSRAVLSVITDLFFLVCGVAWRSFAGPAEAVTEAVSKKFNCTVKKEMF